MKNREGTAMPSTRLPPQQLIVRYPHPSAEEKRRVAYYWIVGPILLLIVVFTIMISLLYVKSEEYLVGGFVIGLGILCLIGVRHFVTPASQRKRWFDGGLLIDRRGIKKGATGLILGVLVAALGVPLKTDLDASLLALGACAAFCGVLWVLVSLRG